MSFICCKVFLIVSSLDICVDLLSVFHAYFYNWLLSTAFLSGVNSPVSLSNYILPTLYTLTTVFFILSIVTISVLVTPFFFIITFPSTLGLRFGGTAFPTYIRIKPKV